MASQAFHVARGPMGAHENGLNGHATVKRLPNGKLVGVFRLETSHGPLTISAELSGVKALAAAKALAPDLAGGARPLPGPWPYGTGDLTNAAGSYQDDMARLRAHAVQLSGHRGGGGHHHHGGGRGPVVYTGPLYGPSYDLPVITVTPEPELWGDAERIYAKLMERDPRAWALLRTLATRTQQGDPSALRLWNDICAAHKRAHAGDFTSATPAEKAAADRMYLRFRRGEPAVVAEVKKIVDLAGRGDVGAMRALKLLCLRHDDAKTSAVMGAAISFHPDRVRDLLEIITRARHAAPPFGYRGGPPPFLPEGGEEPPPMAMPLPGGGGRYAQVLAEQERAKAGPSLITSLGPAREQALKGYMAPGAGIRAVSLRR